jgi:hypothetical protein
MEASVVRQFFEKYALCFNQAVGDGADLDAVASLYASEFIAASPTGVMTGKNDAELKQAMARSYARYRAIGTKDMRLRELRISPIDAHHCVAHVAWAATFARRDQPDTIVDFDVHYFVQKLDAGPKVFGWVSGDEQATLKKHGII